MRQALRFTLALVAGLALLTWAASSWSAAPPAPGSRRTCSCAPQLAVSGARQALVAHWDKEQRSELQGLWRR